MRGALATVGEASWRDACREKLKAAVTEALVDLRAQMAAGEVRWAPPEQLAGWPFGWLAGRLALSQFERRALLLAVADELCPLELRALCALELGSWEADAQPPEVGLCPLILRRWCGEGAPEGTLEGSGTLWRYALLEDQEPQPGSARALRSVRITAGALAFLLGGTDLDVGVRRQARPLPATDLPEVHAAVAADAAGLLGDASGLEVGLLNLHGTPGDARGIAAEVARQLDLTGVVVEARDLLDERQPDANHLRTWARELALRDVLLLVEVDGPPPDATDVSRWWSTLHAALDTLAQAGGAGRGRVLASSSEPLGPHGERPALPLEVPRPPAAQTRSLWARALNLPGAEPEVSVALARLDAQFGLNASAVAAVAAQARRRAGPDADAGRVLAEAWSACRAAGRARMAGAGGLARRLTVRAGWADLVLPDADVQALRDVVGHVRHRAAVRDAWGSAWRDEGVVVLLSGPSGTGKTLAAEVLAAELNVDLYRVDLSGLMSKWLGETEKHLARLLDAADESGAVLLFDEADSVFGRRESSGGGSLDRYANLQTNYLLQRLEAFRGVAVLTTNLPQALDAAFLRRFRFVLRLREPDTALRQQLWARAFPDGWCAPDVNFAELAQLELTGAQIAAVALRAAYLSAQAGGPVSAAVLREALARELRKLGRAPLPSSSS